MKSSRRIFIKQSALATIAAIGAGPLLWTNMGCALAQDDKTKVLPKARPASKEDPANQVNKVPYISTYFVPHKVNVGENAVIDYYVTDYDNKDYMKDDHSETFTVEYWVNSAKTTVPNVKVGDNTVTLEPLPKGKVLFALQATDTQGRKSHRLFQEFLVVDPADTNIPQDKTLTPDLKKFNIYNDDTHPVETTSGLTAMLKSASDNGYRKVLLPKGRYRLDENNTVQMATKLTLDMNGSTLKLNPNALGSAVMFEIVKCFDSHVINGTFEGDLKEHDFKNAPNNSEWVNAVLMGQDATYCSFENIKVVDVTGYGTNTSLSGAGIKSYTTATAKAGIFVPGDIDDKGNAVASDVRMTVEKLVDLTKFKDSFGFFQMGLYLGYQGNPTGSWVYKAHFYDADKKYLETIEGYMYRRMYIPQNAKFVRITVYGASVPAKVNNLTLFNFRHPFNCTFRNVQHENVRCVGMVPSGFINLLVEGCTFENCGAASAKCAFDAEDGWDMAQDLMFRNNKFGNNPHNEFVCISGHNFTVENNVMKAYLRNRYYTVRNNQLKSANFQFGTELSSGTPRVYDNVIAGVVTLSTKGLGKTMPPYREFCIRDNVCNGGVFDRANKEKQVVGYYYKCKIEGSKMNAKVVQCDIKGIKNVGGNFEVLDSTVDNCELKTSGYKLLSKIKGSTITNSKLSTINGAIELVDNKISESSCRSSTGWSDGNEYILTGNTIDTSLDHLIFVGNSYKQVVLDSNTITSTSPKFSAVRLDNPSSDKLTDQVVAITGNTFNAEGGTVLDIPRLPNAACTLTAYLSDNTYHGIEEISKNALDAPNVKIVRAKPTGNNEQRAINN